MKNSFKTKKFKYGGFAAVSTLILVAILIIVNLLVSELNVKFDLTPNSMFSLSDTTNTLLDNIDQEINIYPLYETGKDDPIIMEVLDEYSSKSSNIKVQIIDPILNPNFVGKFKDSIEETIPTGSLIVTDSEAKRFKIVTQSDLLSNNYYTQTQSLNAEQAITSAIDFVTKDELPLVYVVQGHSEAQLSMTLQTQLDNQNYEINQVNLLTDEIEADNENILIINSPSIDFTEDEANKVIEYLEAGGRGLFFTDYYTSDFNNFNDILRRYGIETTTGVVIEGSMENMMGNYATVLIPNIGSHEITDKLSTADLNVVIPQAGGLAFLNEKKSQTTITPLLTTTKESYLRVDPNIETVEKVDGDVDGPFDVALAISEDNYNDVKNITTTTKLVVVSSSLMIDDSLLSTTGNLDFLMSSMNWLSDQVESISILPKDLMPETLTINQAQALLYTGFFVILLPLMILGYGISVWMRRRHL